MPIRLPHTVEQQDPQRQSQVPSGVAPVRVPNPAADVATRPAQQLAGLAANLYAQERDREIETRVREIDIRRRQADADSIGQYLELKGQAAVDARPAVIAQIAENSKRSREGIEDRTVAELWGRQDQALSLSASEQIDAHYRQQNSKWQADTMEARAELLTSDLGRVALGEGYEPATGVLSNEAERTRSAYRSEIAALGKALGWSPEQTEKAHRQADTAAFGGVARNLINGERFQEAIQVLNRHADRIEEGDRQQLLRQARDGARHMELSQKAKAVALDLVAQLDYEETNRHIDLSLGGMNTPVVPRQSIDTLVRDASRVLNEQFAAGKLTAQEADAALQYVQQEHAIRRNDYLQKGNDAYQQAQQWLIDNPTAPMRDVPAGVMRDLKDYGKLDDITAFVANGRNRVTDQHAMVWFDSLTPEQLRAMTPQALFDTMYARTDERDWQHVRARHAEAASSGAGPTIMSLASSAVNRQLETIDKQIKEAGNIAELVLLQDPLTGKTYTPQDVAKAKSQLLKLQQRKEALLHKREDLDRELFRRAGLDDIGQNADMSASQQQELEALYGLILDQLKEKK